MHRLRTQSHGEKRRRARNHAVQYDRNALRRRTQLQTAQTRDIQTADLVQHVARVIRVGFVKRQRRPDHFNFPLPTRR